MDGCLLKGHAWLICPKARKRLNAAVNTGEFWGGVLFCFVLFFLPLDDMSIRLGRRTGAEPPRYALPRRLAAGPFFSFPLVKNLIGQFGVLHPLHPQCGCSSEKMCEQRTWTVCCFLLGPKPITLESTGYQP